MKNYLKMSRYLLILIFVLSFSFSLKVYADSYDSSIHTLEAVEGLLSGTKLANKIISYVNSKGNTVTYEITYGEAILAAGAENNVSPLNLATIILQETGGNLSANNNSPLDVINEMAYDLSSNPANEVTYASFKTTTNVNYREGAGTTYNKVGTLKKDTVIQVEMGYSKRANGYTWYRFKLNSSTYYVASEYLLKDNNPGSDEPDTPAVTYTKYKTTANVNYRDGAGTTYNKKGTLPAGTVIEVENGYSKEANGYTWVRFIYNSGTYYVASEYLMKVEASTPDEPAVPSISYTKYKTTTNVNYRDGAGTSYNKKGTLTKGTVIEVENGYSKTANGYTWVRFKNSSGIYYVASEYLTKTGDATTVTPQEPDDSVVTYTKYKTTTGVNYRSGAGTSYEKVGSLAAGAIIEVENGYSKTANGYTWVRFKAVYGSYYVAVEYLAKVQ